MTSKPRVCVAIEPDLIAVATGEAPPPAAERVEDHVAQCRSCRDDFERYRAIDVAVGSLRATAPPPDDIEAARQRLIARLADLKTRIVSYRAFESPLGRILIGSSEHGVALVEYLGDGGVAGSRLFRMTGVEPHEDGAELERLGRELLDYLAGRRTRLDWALDLRAARSDFERAVLEAAAAVPYGAVESYRGIAGDLGKPEAVRAVAQALRHNPLPIVVPCHRIIGTSGTLTGYSGDKVGLKQRLLAVEGIQAIGARSDSRVARNTLYHYDRNDQHEYCLPTCGDIARRPIGPVTLLASRELAGALGLVPCTACRPDLHPLAA
jgi:methylated-DNA-[protein]-cysteine S-methyltransferase